jgi:hypothetical protein
LVPAEQRALKPKAIHVLRLMPKSLIVTPVDVDGTANMTGQDLQRKPRTKYEHACGQIGSCLPVESASCSAAGGSSLQKAENVAEHPRMVQRRNCVVIHLDTSLYSRGLHQPMPCLYASSTSGVVHCNIPRTLLASQDRLWVCFLARSSRTTLDG